MVMLAGYDIETFGTSNRLICASIVYDTIRGKRKIETFTNKQKLKERIIELGKKQYAKKSRLELYAHNSMYEFSRVFGFDINDQYIKGEKEGIEIICMGKCFLANYMSKEGKPMICFQDSYNLINRSLEECGKIIGLNKIKLNEKTFKKMCNINGKIEDFTQEELTELQEYNIRDSEVSLEIAKYVKKMLKEENYKPRKLITAGQISMSLFNNYCRKNGYQKYFIQWQEEAKDIAKNGYQYIMTKYPNEIHEAYRIGRLEAIQFGEFENTTNLDINSFYAYAMMNIDFPDMHFENKIEKPLQIFDVNTIINSYGITRCKINCPEQELGYLPIRIKYGKHYDENIFPAHQCEMIGTWTNLELAKAVKLGYKIKDIEYTINYKIAETNPLKEFVWEMYQKRLKSSFGKGFYKLVLNNLHGKFAQTTTERKYITADIGETPYLESEGWKVYADIDEYNCLFSKTIAKKYGRNYLPIVSAYTTAKARDLLYGEASKIPRKDLLYLAVDAILFKGEHINKFKIGEGLGEMKIVSKGTSKLKNTIARIYGKNNYTVGEDIRISGVRKEFVKDLGTQKVIEYKRFKNITNSKSLKESFEMEKLTKDLNNIKQRSIDFKTYVKSQKVFIDKEAMDSELID